MIANTEPTASADVTLGTIEKATTIYASSRQNLHEEVAALNAEIAAIKQKHMPRIKRLLADAADDYARLSAQLNAAPHLFDKPKTQTFSGIKVGFRKGAGGIDWDDDAVVCARIRKHFPRAQAELLIKTIEKPIAKALADLDVADLKKIGCTVEATGDVVVIKPTDSEVDKIVNALLKEATEQETAADPKRN